MYETKIDFETGFGYLDDVPAVFSVDTHRVFLMPRGETNEHYLTLKYVQLEDLKISRKQLEAWVGTEILHEIEDNAGEKYDA